MIFNSYLVGEEREEAIEEARIDLVFAKADMMFEMVEMRLQQNLREAELKVFSEGGTYGDFQYLVEEAENEANEKKQGIIATLWNAIKSVLKKIGEKLASINVEPGDENTEVDVDEEDIKTNNAILDAVDKKLPGVEEAVKKRDLSGALKLAGEIAVAGAAVAAGAAVVTKKVTKGNLIKMKTTLTHAKEKVESFFGRIFGSNDSGDESILKQIGTTIKNKIIDPITKLIKKLGDYIKSGVTKAQNAIAGEWKEVEPNTKGATECISNDKTPETNLDHTQMRQEDLEKKGCKGATPGKWYIKETEKNGNRRQYVKCQKGDPGALEVVEDNKDPFNAKEMIKESDVKGVATKGEYVKPNDGKDANKDSGKPKYVKCNSGDEGAKKVVADITDPFDATKMVKASDVDGIASVNDFVKEDNTNTGNNNNNNNNQSNNAPKYVKCNSGDEGALEVVADGETINNGEKKIHEKDVGGAAAVKEFVKPNDSGNNNNNASSSGYEYSSVNDLINGVEANITSQDAYIKISTDKFDGATKNVLHVIDDNNSAKGDQYIKLSEVKKGVYPKGIAANDIVVKIKLTKRSNGKLFLLTPSKSRTGKLNYNNQKIIPVPDDTQGAFDIVDNARDVKGKIDSGVAGLPDTVHKAFIETEEIDNNILDSNPFMESTNEAYDNEIKEIAAMLACL